FLHRDSIPALTSASDCLSTRLAFRPLVRSDGRPGLFGGAVDSESSRPAGGRFRRAHPRPWSVANPGRHPGGANAVCHHLLARGVCQPATGRDAHGLAGRAGLLRRADWSVAVLHSLYAFEEAAFMERGRHSGAQHCLGLRFRTDRLFDERLLLWSSLCSALGHPLSEPVLCLDTTALAGFG